MTKSEATRARWADPIWKARTVQKIREARQGRVAKMPLCDFLAILASSSSITEAAKKLNSSWEAVRYRLQVENLSVPHIQLGTRPNLGRKFPGRETPLDQVMVKNSSYDQGHLKDRLIRDRILQEKCAGCGMGPQWQGSPLVLELHHVNGDRTDARLENLSLLCPNCHSQTPNYAGKNKDEICSSSLPAVLVEIESQSRKEPN